MRARRVKASGGFTLVELVMVIVLIGIIGVSVSSFITGPIRAYMDQSRRAALVDAADTALRRLGREIRLALPNSVRVDASSQNLELIRVTAGGRYCDEPSTDCTAWLDFANPAGDTDFSMTAPFVGLSLPFNSNDHRLVIYNDGSTGANAYDQADVVTPAGAIAVTASQVSFPAFRFAHRSPSKRVFLVEGPVTLRCSPSASGGTLSIVSGYGWQSTQPTSFGGASDELLARHVTGCSFSYLPGATQRAGVVTLELTIGRDGESVTLFHQVQVMNAP